MKIKSKKIKLALSSVIVSSILVATATPILLAYNNKTENSAKEDSTNKEWTNNENIDNLEIQTTGGHAIERPYLIYTDHKESDGGNYNRISNFKDAYGDVKKRKWWLSDFVGYTNWDTTMDNTAFLQGGKNFTDWFNTYWHFIFNWPRNYFFDSWEICEAWYKPLSPTRAGLLFGWGYNGYWKVWIEIDRFQVAEPTRYNSSGTIKTTRHSSTYPSELNQAKINEILTDQLTKGVSSNASVRTSIISYNNIKGEITVNAWIDNAADYRDYRVTLGPYTQTITGFATHQTTQISSGKTLPNAKQFDPQIVGGVDVAKLLAGSSLISNTWNKVSPSDLQVEIKKRDRATGSITTDITIKNWKATNSYGNPERERRYNGVVFMGFKVVKGTNIPNRTIDASGTQVPAIEEKIKISDTIKQLIIAQIKDPYDEITTDDIKIQHITELNAGAGTAKINVQVGNKKWINNDIDEEPVNVHVITDITIDGLGTTKTTLINKVYNYKELFSAQDLPQDLPQDPIQHAFVKKSTEKYYPSDTQLFNQETITKAIENNQNIIFTQLKNGLTAGEVKVESYNINQANGQLDNIQFTIPKDKTLDGTQTRFTFTINGLASGQTEAKNDGVVYLKDIGMHDLIQKVASDITKEELQTILDGNKVMLDAMVTIWPSDKWDGTEPSQFISGFIKVDNVSSTNNGSTLVADITLNDTYKNNVENGRGKFSNQFRFEGFKQETIIQKEEADNTYIWYIVGGASALVLLIGIAAAWMIYNKNKEKQEVENQLFRIASKKSGPLKLEVKNNIGKKPSLEHRPRLEYGELPRRRYDERRLSDRGPSVTTTKTTRRKVY